MMGVSWDTFYRYQATRDAGDVETSFKVNRRKSARRQLRPSLLVPQLMDRFGTTMDCVKKHSVSALGVNFTWIRQDLVSW